MRGQTQTKEREGTEEEKEEEVEEEEGEEGTRIRTKRLSWEEAVNK